MGFFVWPWRSRKKAMDKGTRNCSEANFVRRPYAEKVQPQKIRMQQECHDRGRGRNINNSNDIHIVIIQKRFSKKYIFTYYFKSLKNYNTLFWARFRGLKLKKHSRGC
jgi:hypothetical protein